MVTKISPDLQKIMASPVNFLRLTKIGSNLQKFMALPAILLFSIFFVYPLVRGVGISLTDYDGVSTANFVGLKNFTDFFHDERAMKDILNTLQFGICSAILLNVFGIILGKAFFILIIIFTPLELHFCFF